MKNQLESVFLVQNVKAIDERLTAGYRQTMSYCMIPISTIKTKHGSLDKSRASIPLSIAYYYIQKEEEHTLMFLFSYAEAAPPGQARKEARTDAILTCPLCFTTLCYSCQR